MDSSVLYGDCAGESEQGMLWLHSRVASVARPMTGQSSGDQGFRGRRVQMETTQMPPERMDPEAEATPVQPWRKLKQKQKPGTSYYDFIERKYDVMLAADEELLSGRDLGRKANDLWRTWYMATQISKRKHAEMTVPLKRVEASLAWKRLSPGEKLVWKYFAAANRSANPVPPARVDEHGFECAFWDPPPGLTSDVQGRTRVSAFNCTWNGDWGLDLPMVMESREAGTPLEELLPLQIKHDYYKCLMASFETFCLAWGEKACMHRVSLTMEQSTNGRQYGQVHLAAYFSNDDAHEGMMHNLANTRPNNIDADSNQMSWRTLEFEGVLPGKLTAPTEFEAEGKGTRKGNKFNSRIHEGHYYFQYPKIGLMFAWTNFKKGIDFRYQSRWVLNQWKAGKILIADAIEEALQSKDRCRSTMGELVYQKEQLRMREQMRRNQENLEAIAANERPYHDPPWIVSIFDKQHEVAHKGKCRRSCPLVITGPSMTAKSGWVRSRYFPGRIFVVDCQSVQRGGKLPLKGYADDPDRYDAIVFEEAKWFHVYEDKMLFQGAAWGYKGGVTPTGQYEWIMSTHRVPLYICSNNFFDGLDWDDEEDAYKYVQDNIFHVHVVGSLVLWDLDDDRYCAWPWETRWWKLWGREDLPR